MKLGQECAQMSLYRDNSQAQRLQLAQSLADRIAIDEDRNQFMTVSRTSTRSTSVQTCKYLSSIE